MSLLLLLRAGNAWTQTITDDVGSSDSAATAADHALSLLDNVGPTDALSSAANHFITVTDDAGARDSLGFNTPTDLETLTDTVSFAVGHVVATDDAGLSDNSSRQSQPSSSDVSGLTDTISFAAARATAFTDSAGLSDSVLLSVGRSVSFTDDAGLSDPFVPPQILKITITDDAGLSDPFVPPKQLFVSVTDDAGMTDSASSAENHALASVITDDVGLSDGVSSAVAKPVTDTLVGTDSATQVSSFVRGPADGAGLSDSVITQLIPAQNLSVTINDNAGASDAPGQTWDYVRSAVTDNAGLSDSAIVVGRIINLTLLDQTFSAQPDTVSTAGEFHVTATDDVGLDGTYTSRNQKVGSGGRVLQMVEYISRMQE